MTHAPTALAAALLLALPAARAEARQAFPIPEDVVANARARVDAGWTPGIVVGVVDRAGARYFAYGRAAPGGAGRPVDQRTVFEIGSITKVFTALALADMVVKGEVSLDDPVQRWLPDGARVPTRGDQPITLRLLSAQRSGLPRMPANFAPADPANPYVDYGTARLYAFLDGLTLPREPGASYEYSNLGVGLLGTALARRDGASWEAMVRRRVLGPLRLPSTMQTLSAEARGRMAAGSADGRPAANWDFDALAGAGALRSDAEDMTRFLAAAMGLAPTPLDSAFALTEAPLFDAGSPAMRIGLGWHILERDSIRVVWHNGGTGGFHSFAGFDRARGVGVVVLTNSTENIDDIGFHTLNPAIPLAPVRTAVALPAESLEAYVGRYDLAPTFSITVTREGDALYGQATGQGVFRLYASAPDEFFLKVVAASVSFVRGEGGRVTAMILHQNGRDVRGERVP